MEPPKPGTVDAQDQAPEVSYRRDDGPIVAAAYTTGSFDYSPQYQQHPDKSLTGSTPVQQPFLPPFAQSMHSMAPPASQQESSATPPPTKRRKWIWPVALVVAALVALGAGIGIGYAVGDNNSSSSSASSNPPSGTSSSSSSAPVTSGNTGITAYSCNASSTYASPFGSSFAQDCHVSYKTNQSAYDNASVTVTNFAGLTVYSFETCMDECVKRNRQLDIGNMLGAPCVAVSFYANLTYSIPAWAGNCFIKNAKGVGRNWDPNSNASLTASAYMVELH